MFLHLDLFEMRSVTALRLFLVFRLLVFNCRSVQAIHRVVQKRGKWEPSQIRQENQSSEFINFVKRNTSRCSGSSQGKNFNKALKTKLKTNNFDFIYPYLPIWVHDIWRKSESMPNLEQAVHRITWEEISPLHRSHRPVCKRRTTHIPCYYKVLSIPVQTSNLVGEMLGASILQTYC